MKGNEGKETQSTQITKKKTNARNPVKDILERKV